jgi:F0F1-type ATP synthase alpha subunit
MAAQEIIELFGDLITVCLPIIETDRSNISCFISSSYI